VDSKLIQEIIADDAFQPRGNGCAQYIKELASTNGMVADDSISNGRANSLCPLGS
jgi:hypothetical protein